MDPIVHIRIVVRTMEFGVGRLFFFSFYILLFRNIYYSTEVPQLCSVIKSRLITRVQLFQGKQ